MTIHWLQFSCVILESALLSDDLLVADRMHYMMSYIPPSLNTKEAWKRFKIPLDVLNSEKKKSWSRAIIVSVEDYLLLVSLRTTLNLFVFCY